VDGKSVAAVKIGVLALQGAFAKHEAVLSKLGAITKQVRKPDDLLTLDGLIIPGGESTTMLYHLEFIKLTEALCEFAKEKPIFGTCAGLILMSKEIASFPKLRPFGLLDIVVERNAYGRQAESFCSTIDISFPEKKSIRFPALFIRAPSIKSVGPEIKVLASYEGAPVFVQQGIHMGASFHPELTDHSDIHRYFIKNALANRS